MHIRKINFTLFRLHRTARINRLLQIPDLRLRRSYHGLSLIHIYNKMRMSSGYHQTDKRRFQILIFNIIGTDMSFDMVYADKRDSCCKADCLSSRHPD